MYQLTEHLKVHERRDWGARPPRDVSLQADPHEAFIHHGAEPDQAADRIDTHAELNAAMRATQNFHMDGRGWSDIAYHYMIFQPRGRFKYAHIAEGRMVHHVPAAQLGHNTGTLAICVFGTVDQTRELKDNTIWAIAQLLKGVRGNMTGIRAIKVVGGHKDVTQTSCPGNVIYHALDRIARDAGIERYH